ncbi:MAG: hypothetical protein IKH86_04410 [Prevotella sp.]|nr:hypothetical protein [Prevotella sp.]
MKKFTLITLLVFIASLGFAQRNVDFSQLKSMPVKQNVLKKVKGHSRTAATTTMSKAPRKAAELVTPPSGKEVEQWYFDGLYLLYTKEGPYDGYDDYTSVHGVSKDVIIDGNDVYIKGLSILNPDGWIKGTINGNKVVFPTGQYVGTQTLEGSDIDFFIVGQTDESETAADVKDIVFDYDAEKGELSLSSNTYILDCIMDPGNMNYNIGYWVSLELMKEAPTYELVTPPSEGEDYTLEDGMLTYWDDEANDGEGDWADGTSQIAGDFKVVIDGTDIYLQGIDAKYLPEGWIKGTISGNTATFPSGQYVGTDEDGYSDFIVGGDNTTGEITDIVFAYDPETGKLTLDENVTILITGKANSLVPYYMWEAMTITPKNPINSGISTVNTKTKANVFYNLQGVKMNRPTQKGLYIVNGKKVVVK